MASLKADIHLGPRGSSRDMGERRGDERARPHRGWDEPVGPVEFSKGGTT